MDYKNIIEEHKADAGSVAMLDALVHCGFFTPKRRQEIITSWLVAYLYPAANFKTAHSKRNIMQHNMLFENGAIKLDNAGRMVIDFNRVTERGYKMFLGECQTHHRSRARYIFRKVARQHITVASMALSACRVQI